MELMNGAAKKRLYELVDKLPDEEIQAAERYLQFLRDHGSDPYAHLEHEDALDESDRERLHASLLRGLAQAKAGQGRPVDDFLAEMQEP